MAKQTHYDADPSSQPAAEDPGLESIRAQRAVRKAQAEQANADLVQREAQAAKVRGTPTAAPVSAPIPKAPEIVGTVIVPPRSGQVMKSTTRRGK